MSRLTEPLYESWTEQWRRGLREGKPAASESRRRRPSPKRRVLERSHAPARGGSGAR